MTMDDDDDGNFVYFSFYLWLFLSNTRAHTNGHHITGIVAGKKGKMMERRILKDFQIGIVESIVSEAVKNTTESRDVFTSIAKAINKRSASRQYVIHSFSLVYLVIYIYFGDAKKNVFYCVGLLCLFSFQYVCIHLVHLFIYLFIYFWVSFIYPLISQSQ